MKSLVCYLFLVLLIVACVTTPESGRRAFILTSEGQENQMGLQAYQEMMKKEKLSSNTAWNEILQRVGKRIAAASKRSDYQWEFKLVESKEMNAFCLPGGKVAFYTGIVPIFENEAQMAAVMGHEVAHAVARHGGQRITMALGTQIGLAGLSAALGGSDENPTKGLLLSALGVGATLGAVLPFSRSNETEADEIGIRYMARAGYDPREASKFWGRFAKATGGSGQPSFLSTHPSSQGRQENLAAKVNEVMPEYERSPKHGTGVAIH